MAKRNQVTADLRISANAQLKNSQSFIKELERITSGFDFGNKINSQLEIAKGQLKEYNKVLSKVQNKSAVSDEELKNIVKAGKEIASLVAKTQSLYKNLNGGDLKKYSREYIAETKRIEQTITKIKQDYANKTGKNFDKELANYDKLLAKNKELKKQREQLAKSGVEELVTKQIEQTTQKLEQQKKKLEEIKTLREQSSKTYSNTLNQEAVKRGYKDYNDLNNRKVLNEDQIKKNIGTNIYKQEKQELTAISKELKSIESIKDNAEAQNKKAISLAAKYNIENVKDLNTLKAQLKVRQDLLNTYKNDKSKLALRNQQLITEEIRKQNQLAKDKAEVKNVAKTAELNVITAGGYSSKASLSASYATTNKSVNNLGSQLTESGIETITNNATAQIKSILQTIDNDIRNSNNDLSSIDETNKKIATQSERVADEQDVKNSGKETVTNINKNTDNDGKETRETIRNSNDNIIQRIEKIESPSRDNYASGLNESVISSALEEVQTYVKADGQSVILSGKDKIENSAKSFNNYLKMIEDMEKIPFDNIKEKQNFRNKMENALDNVYTNFLEGMEESIKDIETFAQENIKKRNKNTNKNGEITKAAKKRGYTEQELTKDMQNQDLYQYDLQHFKNYLVSNAEEEYRLEKEYLSKYNEELIAVERNIQSSATAEATLQQRRQSTKDVTNENTQSQEKLNNALNNGAKSIEIAAQQSSYIGSTFDDIRNKIGYFLSLNYVFDQMTRKITEAVQVTKEMDRDMTQIGLVLGKTSGQVWKNFDTYSKMAERLNTTTSQVTNSMKLFYQQGLNTSEVNKMVEASAIAAALGESTMAEASETLTSIINSYNLSANEAMMVTDKISQIAIVSAADFGELSTAIEKVASSAASAGLDLDHMMGYLGKMIETTREAPTNIGTALKTIIANFTQFKEDPTGLNEEGTEINKVDKALKSVGISLTDTNGEVRDLGEVLDELGGIWDTLNRNQKSYLATAIAGTRQQSRFYALMNDYERTLELVAEGSNSAGKAQQQFGLYTDSLEAATNRLTNQWEKFFNSITSGNGAIKIATDGLTALMKVINLIGPLGSALGLTSFVVQLRKGINEINNFSNGVNKLKDDKDSFDFFAKIKKEINEIKTNKELTQDQKVDKIKLKNEEVKSYSAKKEIPNLLDNFNNVEKIIKAQEEIDTLNTKISIEDDLFAKLKLKGTKALESIKLGAMKGKIAITAMGKAIGAAMLQMAAVFVVTKIFEGLFMMIDAATTSSEELKESMTQHQDNATTIEGLRKEYEELAKKVNKTAEEEERLKEITEEVTKIDAALGSQLRNNEKAYQSNIKAMQEYSKLQKELAAQDAAKAIKKENGLWSSFLDSTMLGEGYWADYKATFGDTQEQITLKNERFNQWRNLANARGSENNLSDSEMEMLNNYIEDLISKNQNLTAEQVKTKTNQADKAINEYINSLKNMPKEQKNEYEALKQYGVDNNNSLNDFYKKIQTTSLDESTKNQMMKNLQDTANDVKFGQLVPNYFINDVEGVFRSLVDNLSQEKLEELFNKDLSSLDENEKINYQKDMAELFSNENIDTFISKFKIGGEAFDNYINSLKNEGKIADSTAEVLVGLKNSADTASKALSSLENFENIINSTLREGKLSQTDIMKKIISNEIGMGNIQIHKTGVSQNVTGGTGLGYQTSFMTVDTKSIVANAMKEIKNFLSPIKDRQNTLNEQYNQHSNIPQREIDNARKMQEAAQNKVNDLQNKLKEAQTNLEDKRGDYVVRDASFITRPLQDTINFFKGKDVVGDFENAQQEVKNYQKQLEEAQEELKNTTEETKNAEQAAKNLTDETTEVGKAFKEEGEYLKEQADQAKDTYDALEQLAQLQIKPMADFSAVFDQFQVMGQVDQQLDSLQKAWDMATSDAQNYRDVAALIAQDPSLINAIDMESEYLQFSDEALKEHAKNILETEKTSIDSKIKGTEAIIACLEGQVENSSAWEEATNEDIASAMAYNEEMFMQQQLGTESQAKSLTNSSEQYAEWGNSVQRAYQAVEQARVQYIKGLNSESETNYLSSITNLRGVTLKGSTGELPTVDKNNVEATKNQILGKAAGDDAKTKEMIEKYKTQLSILQKLKNSLNLDIKNPEKLFERDSNNSGGSKDSYEQQIEKLEHFYNYLRKIEKLEAKIERIRTRRSIIDETENYYIDSLIKENKLLKEQSSLYENYINDQVAYLTQLRQQLLANYSDWVGFDNEGAVQVKRVNYAIKSEGEEERYQEYSDLLNEYQSQYQTYLDTQNSLLSTQQTIIENIKTAYDKINQKLEDTMENLDYINSINEHNSEMAIGNLKQLSAYNKELSSTVDMYNFASQSLANLKADMNEIANKVNSMGLGQFVNWDSTANRYMTNDNFNNAVSNGTIDNETLTTVQSIVAASQALNEEWKQMYERIMSIESSLKSIIENRLNAIEDLVSGWKNEVEDLFNIINRQLDTKNTVMNLVGYNTADLEEKYKIVANAAAVAKLSWEETQKLTKQALDNLTAEYGDYVQMINDTPFIDKKGIEESTNLTDIQKEKAKELITTYEQLKEATDNLEDVTYDYLNTLKDLQEQQLNQTIDILQKIHDELRNIDQEELDDLKNKYDKMTALDNEYYSKLSQRINDFRNQRTKLQDQQTLVQKQNQLTALQQDNSGQYNSQIVELQNEINQLLQNKADTNIDDQLERIQREQEQRAEDRAMQEQQLENLITFKDENKVYWEQAVEMLGEGYAVVSGFLATREQNADQSELATQEAIAQTNQKLMDVYAKIDQYSVKDIQTSADIKSMLKDFLTGSGESSIAGLLNKLGLVDTDITSTLSTKFDNISSVINNGFISSFGQIKEGFSQFWNQFGQLRENITGNLTNTTQGISNAVSASGTGIVNAVNSSIGRVHSDAVSIGATDAQIQKNTKSTADSSGSTARNTGASAGNTRRGGSSVADLAADVDSNVARQAENLNNINNNTWAARDALWAIKNKVTAGWTITQGEAGIAGSFLAGLGLTLRVRKGKIYKTGGYADYTGPAWVDGTKSKPEAFLNAKQTELFETLRDALVRVPRINSKEESNSENISIENFTIDVKELADTDSIDKVVKTVKDSIYRDATSGNNMKINRRR